MKIENTSMEFVVFDAQDVITTSGPAAATAWFAITEDLLDSAFARTLGWEDDPEIRGMAALWGGDHNAEFGIYDHNGMKFSIGDTVSLAENANYQIIDGDEGGLKLLNGYTFDGTGKEEDKLTSMTEIIGWLGTYGVQ